MEVKHVLVTGAGGFIGTHLVRHLKRQGHHVRGVDLHLPRFSPSDADEMTLLDLRIRNNCLRVTSGIDEVYALAADMGGVGYLTSHSARLLHDNSLINLHTLEAARQQGARRFFFASSACVYPESRQNDPDVVPLREEDALPAQPQDSYGWEKLTTERLCLDYAQEFGIEVRIARFHNIYGPLGAWEGGREKAPAALCRKIAIAKLTGASEIEIWGDGRQTRSFCHIDDCVIGIDKLMQSDWREPLNLGRDRLITISDLVDTIMEIAGVTLEKRFVPGPQGVRGRNSDNTRMRSVLGWAPEIPLEEGLPPTYAWIEEQVRHHLKLGTS